MNILILGATGYLGGNIASSLVKQGHHVICTVRQTSDISRLIDISGIKLISSDPAQIELTFRQEKIDWVINGVCTYHPNASLYGDMLESNVIFPLSVLNLAIKYGIMNYMTMGTGLPAGFNVYSFTKAKFSDFGRFLSEKDRINFADLRLEMFYGGENEPENRFMKSCRLKLNAGQPLALTEGTQKRDIVRVEDILGIINRLIETNFAKGYQILPVGSGESHSIRETIEYMKSQMDSTSELQFGALQPRNGKEPDTIADISWLHDIQYELKYSFFKGLQDICRGDSY